MLLLRGIEEVVEADLHVEHRVHEAQAHSHAEVEEALQTHNLVNDESWIERRRRFVATHCLIPRDSQQAGKRERNGVLVGGESLSRAAVRSRQAGGGGAVFWKKLRRNLNGCSLS